MNAIRLTLGCLGFAAQLTALWSAGGGLGHRMASAQGIFTCVDVHGHRLTSDRSIPECTDREQRELNASGTLKRQVGPTLTAKEQAAQDEKAQAVRMESSRLKEERRRDLALLGRYPNPAAHDRVRAASLVQIDGVIASAHKQLAELGRQRKDLDAEMEFYKSNPAKAPAQLKQQMDENTASVAVQKRFVADQEGEKNRVNARFDTELAKLKTLWPISASATR